MRLEGRGKKKREEGGKEKKKRGEEEENLLLITLHCRPWSAFIIRIKLTHICTPLLKGARACCALGSAGPFACIVPISPGTTATAPGSTCIVKITDTPSKSPWAFLCIVRIVLPAHSALPFPSLFPVTAPFTLALQYCFRLGGRSLVHTLTVIGTIIPEKFHAVAQ